MPLLHYFKETTSNIGTTKLQLKRLCAWCWNGFLILPSLLHATAETFWHLISQNFMNINSSHLICPKLNIIAPYQHTVCRTNKMQLRSINSYVLKANVNWQNMHILLFSFIQEKTKRAQVILSFLRWMSVLMLALGNRTERAESVNTIS